MAFCTVFESVTRKQSMVELNSSRFLPESLSLTTQKCIDDNGRGIFSAQGKSRDEKVFPITFILERLLDAPPATRRTATAGRPPLIKKRERTSSNGVKDAFLQVVLTFGTVRYSRRCSYSSATHVPFSYD